MVVAYCSRTSRKGSPRMSSPGGRLREVVDFERLDDIGLNFAYGNCRDLSHV